MRPRQRRKTRPDTRTLLPEKRHFSSEPVHFPSIPAPRRQISVLSPHSASIPRPSTPTFQSPPSPLSLCQQELWRRALRMQVAAVTIQIYWRKYVVTVMQRSVLRRKQQVTAAVKIQSIFRGFRAREDYKADKIFIDIENMHQKYKRIKEEFGRKQKEAVEKISWKMRGKVLKMSVRRWAEQTRRMRALEKTAPTLVRVGGRPAALNITPSWKSKIRRTEPISAGVELMTPTRRKGVFSGKEPLRRKSTLKTRSEIRERFEQWEIKELASPDTGHSTQDSDMRLKRK